MLGLKYFQPGWEWAVCGKHPSFADYIYHNLNPPLLKSVAGWIDHSAPLIHMDGNDDYQHFTYRFWVRGIKKGSLVCGIVKNSSDRSGRSYPLAMMGTGLANGWEKQWEFVFGVFDPIFRGLEAMTSSRFDTFQQFESRLGELQVSKNFWQEATAMMGRLNRAGNDTQLSTLPSLLKIQSLELLDKSELTLPLDGDIRHLARTWKSRWHKEIFKKPPPVPTAVFFGGSAEESVVRIFNRALDSNDFKTLFSKGE